MEVADMGEEGRRPSIEKKPFIISDDQIDSEIDYEDEQDVETSAFERLPDEIIQQILEETDSNGFASLALLNSKWRSVAQQAHLYAHHLANCPSYAMSHKNPPKFKGEDDLPRLRRLFAKEVKRNLFEAYLRPNQTIIKVISNSISSSSCPGGEGIQFSASPKGHHLLAYNSSRIHVIDVRGSEIEVKRELKILRRPVATCINDQGSMLAVLLTEMQVDVYDLTQTPPKRSHSMILDHIPRAIALSPCGFVLAAAYEGGIEVSSLNQTSMATDRRAVKCDAVDALTFSFDGTQLLGTTVHSSQPNTVIITAPYYDPGSLMADDDISALWTTSILFPNTSRDCSHAVLIQEGKHEEAGWTFTYDRSFETFRAVRIDDLRNGTTYFTGPVPDAASQNRLIPCTLPAASYYGELVSAGFQGKDIWLYGIPEDLDAVPDMANAGSEAGSGANGLLRRNSGPSARSASRVQENDATRVPQWQILCDKLRNTFVGGYKVGELEGVSTVKFVADFADSCIKERLIVAARGVVPNVCIGEDEGMDFVDGGRITVVDFDYSTKNGETREIEIEVGTKEPEVLEEEHRDIETEVAIVRRRTVAQKRASRSAAVMRSATSAARPPPLPTQVASSTQQTDDDGDDPLVPRRIGAPPATPRRANLPTAAAEEGETESIIEEQEALDAPYSQGDPRSGTTLRRAATAAANNRRLQHQQPAAGPVEYRRADGRAEHPHESDADNWVPPPPPYQKEDPGDLPAFLRHTAIPAPAPAQPAENKRHPPVSMDNRQAARMSSASMHQQPRRSQTVASSNRHSSPVPPVPPLPSISAIPPVPALPALPASVSSLPPVPRIPAAAHERSGSSLSIQRTILERPSSRDSRYHEGENIYDVSPPDSPALAPVRQQVSQEPSENRVISNPTPPAAVISPPTATQRQFPLAAHGQRGSVSQESTLPPVHDRLPHIGQTIIGDQSSRRVSVSRTWPTQPVPINTAAAAAVATNGYPYSAPPVQGSEALSQSYPPPVPRVDHIASLSNRLDISRPMSSDFELPPRLPISEYAHPASGSSSEDIPPWRRTSYQRPISQQQHYSFPFKPASPHQRTQSQATIHEPQPRRPEVMTTPIPPQEEMPLIISTPKGVSGAFDPPERRISGRRAETPILAPVPRHPRPITQSAILRPPVAHQQQPPEHRLDMIYSISGGLNAPPAPGSSVGRVPSLNRKPSRAERSAAKNIADAKKRGWTGRSKSKKGKGKKKKDFDVMSNSAWTNITVDGAGGGGGGGLFLQPGQPMPTFNTSAKNWKKDKAKSHAGTAISRLTRRGNGDGEGGGGKCLVM
ncbi:hypothetical protein QBC38DRAFT_237455 [Podospora fimiseda]|uniref:F-box domain-containing protein n=1 Tax=Podospora fimiseda TaxID=252190 RepID=A0AAN7BMG7_9PEZI|nr:hypothetical protein QBC38DRAFT_237455 [Podospora fimiseda]